MMRAPCLFVLVLFTACSDGDGSNGSAQLDAGDGTGGTGAGGVASGGNGGDVTAGGSSGTGGAASGGSGGNASGGSASGGAPTGGAGGGTGGSLFDPADHCAPGQYYGEGELTADRAFGGLAIRCSQEEREQAIANGLDDGDGMIVITSIRLPEPMQVDQATSISAEMESLRGGPTRTHLEYWATTSECGTSGPLEKFYEQGIDATNVYCGSITPSVAYSYILEVTRPRPEIEGGGSTRRGVTLCMSGSCPAP